MAGVDSSVSRTLSRVGFFQDLPLAALDSIAPWCREEVFPADSYIFREGDPATRFWIVRYGQVKIVKYSNEGKEIIIEVIPPGETFGGASMLMGFQPATAQALTPATVLSFTVARYRDIMMAHPAVSLRVIEALGERLHGVIQMRIMASQRIERRVAHILLKMADKCGQQRADGWMLTISMTRQDIADLVDTTLETAIRVMSSFHRQGLVRTERGGYIVLLDVEELQRRAGRP